MLPYAVAIIYLVKYTLHQWVAKLSKITKKGHLMQLAGVWLLLS